MRLLPKWLGRARREDSAAIAGAINRLATEVARVGTCGMEVINRMGQIEVILATQRSWVESVIAGIEADRQRSNTNAAELISEQMSQVRRRMDSSDGTNSRRYDALAKDVLRLRKAVDGWDDNAIQNTKDIKSLTAQMNGLKGMVFKLEQERRASPVWPVPPVPPRRSRAKRASGPDAPIDQEDGA